MRALMALRRAPLPVRVAAGVALALAVGLLLNSLRALPDRQPTLLGELLGGIGYLGESAAPFLLVPFAVGLLARTRVGAAAGGLLACWSLVAAYYGWFLPGSFAAERGNPGEQAFWLVAGVAPGTICGLLGRASILGSRAGFVMPAALVLEPLGWLLLLYQGIAPVLAQPQNVAGAVVEAVVGAVWILLLARSRATGRSALRPGATVTAR